VSGLDWGIKRNLSEYNYQEKNQGGNPEPIVLFDDADEKHY